MKIPKKDSYFPFNLLSGFLHLLTLPDFVSCLYLGFIIDLILVLKNTIYYLKSRFWKFFYPSLWAYFILVFNFIRPYVMHDSKVMCWQEGRSLLPSCFTNMPEQCILVWGIFLKASILEAWTLPLVWKAVCHSLSVMQKWIQRNPKDENKPRFSRNGPRIGWDAWGGVLPGVPCSCHRKIQGTGVAWNCSVKCCAWEQDLPASPPIATVQIHKGLFIRDCSE